FTLRAVGARSRAAVARRSLIFEAPSFTTSTNWSGYAVDSTNMVTAVSGEFNVPILNCTDTPDASESMWVGIGGAGESTGDLLQTGVRSDCVGGVQVENPGWWEEYPEYPSVDFTGMVVSPGDHINASVYRTSVGGRVTS